MIKKELAETGTYAASYAKLVAIADKLRASCPTCARTCSPGTPRPPQRKATCPSIQVEPEPHPEKLLLPASPCLFVC